MRKIWPKKKQSRFVDEKNRTSGPLKKTIEGALRRASQKVSEFDSERKGS